MSSTKLEWRYICPVCGASGLEAGLSMDERMRRFGWSDFWMRYVCSSCDSHFPKPKRVRVDRYPGEK